MLAVALALTLLAPSHSRSEGKSRFVLDEDGRVAVTIELGEPDLPELCNADLTVAERAREEQKLTRCLETGLPRWLRITADERACPIAYRRFSEEARTITIDAQAVCAAPPRRLVIDWGLFAGSALDHVSVAVVEQPHAKARLVLLSKRSSRFALDVARPWWLWALGVAATLALVAGACGVLRRRRRATAARAPD
ncbi:MAG: hypothetical protein A2138_11055 [Deltaproteobacteria bacterium RBG_16_71_12]|nr:MAG: hypothetical protein A2138_11055 [Deltaproteobacteria bacterium RBG_16_71_12]